MRILSWYVAKTVLLSCLLVLFVILSLDMLAVIIDEMQDASESYTFLDIIKYALLTLPSDLHAVLPFAILIGCLAGLGGMANQSELVVIRSAGVSHLKIIAMVMMPVLFLAASGFLIGEYVAPKTQQMAKAQQATAKNKQLQALSTEGFWYREKNLFMHVTAVGVNGDLLGVHQFEYSDDFQLVKSQFAESAEFLSDEGQPIWLLKGVTSSSLSAASIQTQQHDELSWGGSLNPSLIKILSLSPDDLATKDLWSYFRYLKEQNLDSADYEVAFWKKLLQPLAILSLVIIAVSFIFGSLRNVTMGFRIFIGVMVGIVFRTLQEILGPASMVYGFEPILAVLLPITLCLLFGFFMFNKKV